ncbi:hypothetical protein QJQ45_014474, partial [Haematococcus lacustris]
RCSASLLSQIQPDRELSFQHCSTSCLSFLTPHQVAPSPSWHRMAESFDSGTRERVQKIPLLTTNAGPRDKDKWNDRLREELRALIQYIQHNKDSDMDWFTIEPVDGGHSWRGKCWYIHNLVRYEFDFRFDIPATYPAIAPEIELPELDGKTAKMYRGGKICLTIHFKPLWAKN